MLIIVILLLINTGISMVPPQANSIILNLVGALTAPLVMFMLPGYLFYDHSCRLEVLTPQSYNYHRWLSLGILIIGWIMVFTMATIAFYIIRAESV